MNIGNVIRKYRKEAGLTQELMAKQLGVTTPAVNKWENGNSYPDIELLAPIARLLHISLDTLLSFREELTPAEIADLIRQIDTMFETEGFEKTYEWISKLIQEYPNCNMLIWQAAVVLDARRLTGDCEDPDQYDKPINSWYEMALRDKNEEIQRNAADSLFGFYLRKKEYAKAEEYLAYFSDHDPMKKTHKGRLYMEQGRNEEACEIFETMLFSEYQTLNLTLSMLLTLALKEQNTEDAHFFASKLGDLAKLFDMGKYNECSAMLDVMCSEKNVEGTYEIVKQLLENVDSLYDFRKSTLFRHMKFRSPDSSYPEWIRTKLLEGFRSGDEFAYMNGLDQWRKLMEE